MRFKQPELGDIKYKRKFAWIPITKEQSITDNLGYTYIKPIDKVWLEYYYIKQTYVYNKYKASCYWYNKIIFKHESEYKEVHNALFGDKVRKVI